MWNSGGGDAWRLAPRADVDGPAPPPEAAESAEAAAAASSPAFLSWLARMPMPSAAIMRWFLATF